MPPPIAAVACICSIAYLFWAELRQPDRQRISWAPFVWMFLAGSRFASYWLNLGSPQSLNAWEEGSPVDRTVFFSLIAWGVIVLSRRSINWSSLLSKNWLISVYFLYCLSSLLWSDELFVLTKRWIKDLGNPIMALVLLTEAKPYDAIVATFRRLSFVILPLSVVFIKYFPDLGRAHAKNGMLMFTGVATHKNTLGMSCLLIAICLAWNLQRHRGLRTLSGRKRAIEFVLVGLLSWLLYMSNSQTSIACLVVALVVLIAARLPGISAKPSRLVVLIAVIALTYGIFQSLFDVNAYVYAVMGRDPTLTNRTAIWEALKSLGGNSVVGTGFMSFWNPQRLAAFQSRIGDAFIQQAHNGYLEQQLNLGYVGIAFIVAIMVRALFEVRRHLDQDTAPALLRLCFLVTAALYNYTEASFYGVNNMWVVLLTASIHTTGTIPAFPNVLGADRFPNTTIRRSRVRYASRRLPLAISPLSIERDMSSDRKGRTSDRGSRKLRSGRWLNAKC